MSIQVVKPGLFTTIQDFGRFGYQKYGVVVGGVVDPFSARIANLLVGNEGTESVVEITIQGPSLYFEQDAVVAICGGDMAPDVDGAPIQQWRPILVKAGHSLSVHSARSGCRAYLAIAGGFDIPLVLGSASTFLRGGFGGVQGRALQAGDTLTALAPNKLSQMLFARLSGLVDNRQLVLDKQHAECTPLTNSHTVASWGVSHELYSYIPDARCHALVKVRAMDGPEYTLFDADSRKNIFNSAYQVTPRSDRMGCRLNGQALALTDTYEMISEAVTVGTVQVPPDGNPIILLADRQTTGGYPRIAQVANVDIPIVGQCMPGTSIEFCHVSVAKAQHLYIEKLKELETLAYQIRTSIQSGT